MAASRGFSKLVKDSSFRWAVSGWAFFIAENAILSENRTWLIAELGDPNYHVLYGTFSTVAMGSIGYAYHVIATRKAPVDIVVKSSTVTAALVASWTSLTLGMIMASQTLPKLQIPVTSSLQVRCPFDFSDRQNNPNTINGLERVSRHSGLWSLAFLAAGTGLLQSSRALRAWYMGPTAVAWLGGWHNDSRFRRNMGGTMDPQYESLTSNIPFVAILTGKQGAVGTAFEALWHEIKPLNAALAAVVATMYVVHHMILKHAYQKLHTFGQWHGMQKKKVQEEN